MSNKITHKTFHVGECDVPPTPPEVLCPIKANIIESCDSDNTIILTSASTVFNKTIVGGDLSLSGMITTYQGQSVLGMTFSGSSNGMELVPFPSAGSITANTYTTGVSLSGNVLSFDRTDIPNAYQVDLTPIIPIIPPAAPDYFTTGATLVDKVAVFNRNDAASAYTLDLTTLVPVIPDAELDLPEDFFISCTYAAGIEGDLMAYKTDVFRSLNISGYTNAHVYSTNSVQLIGNTIFVHGQLNNASGNTFVLSFLDCHIVDNELVVGTALFRELPEVLRDTNNSPYALHGSDYSRGFMFFSTRATTGVSTQIFKINVYDVNDVKIMTLPNTGGFDIRVGGLHCYKNFVYVLGTRGTTASVLKIDENLAAFELLFQCGNVVSTKRVTNSSPFVIYNDEIYIPTIYNSSANLTLAYNSIGLYVYSIAKKTLNREISDVIISTGSTTQPTPHWMNIFNGKIVLHTAGSSAANKQLVRFDSTTLAFEESRALPNQLTNNNSITRDGYILLNTELTFSGDLYKVKYNNFADFSNYAYTGYYSLGSPEFEAETESLKTNLSQFFNDGDGVSAFATQSNLTPLSALTTLHTSQISSLSAITSGNTSQISTISGSVSSLNTIVSAHTSQILTLSALTTNQGIAIANISGVTTNNISQILALSAITNGHTNQISALSAATSNNASQIITLSAATAAGLLTKEDVSNKTTGFTVVNDTLYPTVKAVRNAITGATSIINNTFVTGATYNNTTKTLNLTRNDGVVMSATGWQDIYITGGTYSVSGKTLAIRTNSATTVTITGVTEITQTINSGATFTAPSEAVVYTAINKNLKSYIITSGNTLPTVAGLRPLFTGFPVSGITVEANTSYRLECNFGIQSTQTGGNGVQFGVQGTVGILQIGYFATLSRTGTYLSNVAQYSSFIQTTNATSLVSSASGGFNQITIRGTFTTTNAGTFIPAVNFTITSGGLVEAGSFLILDKLGPLYSSDAI